MIPITPHRDPHPAHRSRRWLIPALAVLLGGTCPALDLGTLDPRPFCGPGAPLWREDWTRLQQAADAYLAAAWARELPDRPLDRSVAEAARAVIWTNGSARFRGQRIDAVTPAERLDGAFRDTRAMPLIVDLLRLRLPLPAPAHDEALDRVMAQRERVLDPAWDGPALLAALAFEQERERLAASPRPEAPAEGVRAAGAVGTLLSRAWARGELAAVPDSYDRIVAQLAAWYASPAEAAALLDGAAGLITGLETAEAGLGRLVEGHLAARGIGAARWPRRGAAGDPATAAARALAAFQAAADRRPGDPRPTTGLVVAGLLSGQEAGIPDAFARTMRIACDFDPLYGALFAWTQPAMGGSDEGRLRFGIACVDTGRFDTELPWRMIQVLMWVPVDSPARRDPAVRVAVERCLDATRARYAAVDPDHWIWLEHQRAALRHQFGDLDGAAAALSRVPDERRHDPFLAAYGLTVERILDGGPQGPAGAPATEAAGF